MEGVKKELGAYREQGICLNEEKRIEEVWKDAEARFNEPGFDDSIENWIFFSRQRVYSLRYYSDEETPESLAIPGIYYVHALLVLKVGRTYYEKKKHEYKFKQGKIYEECLEGRKKVDELMARLMNVIAQMESKAEEVKDLYDKMNALKVELRDMSKLYKETHLNGEKVLVRGKSDELTEAQRRFYDVYEEQESSYIKITEGDYASLVKDVEEVYLEFRKEVDAYYFELKGKKNALAGKADTLAVIEGQQNITASRVNSQFLTSGERASIAIAVILLAGVAVKACYGGLSVGMQSSDASGDSDGRAAVGDKWSKRVNRY